MEDWQLCLNMLSSLNIEITCIIIIIIIIILLWLHRAGSKYSIQLSEYLIKNSL